MTRNLLVCLIVLSGAAAHAAGPRIAQPEDFKQRKSTATADVADIRGKLDLPRQQEIKLSDLGMKNRDRMTGLAALYGQSDGRSAFDGNSRAAGAHPVDGGPSDGIGFAPEPGGWEVRGQAGGGGQGGKGVGTYGFDVRYGIPIAGGTGGNVGPMIGFNHTLRDNGHSEDTSNVTYQSSDGQYQVVDGMHREVNDTLNLFEFAGLSYQTPSIASNGRKLVNFEVGGKLGVGRKDTRVFRTDSEDEQLLNTYTHCDYDQYGNAYNCYDYNQWDTQTHSESTVQEGGESVTKAFVSAFVAANVAIVDDLDLRLELSRKFLGQFGVPDATVGSVGVSYHFDLHNF